MISDAAVRAYTKLLLFTLVGAALLAVLFVGPSPNPPTVVAVRVLQPGGSAEIATGVVVASGHVMTVAHVFSGDARIEVTDPRGALRPATVARSRASQDLALLDAPRVTGTDVRYDRAVGPLQVLLRRTNGVTARPAELRRRIAARLVGQPGRPRRAVLELTARIVPGDSGAPVIDADGDVVGILFARSTRRDGIAYAVSTDAASALP